ncbi:hypothetical protein DFH06DRAFT_595115 [Mycena polygramma]|nr:hypothetical protein DFH06DRAFT_595115 [Mycena polygramma]
MILAIMGGQQNVSSTPMKSRASAWTLWILSLSSNCQAYLPRVPSPPPMSALRDLSEDAALLILEACDISTVVSMGQVNVFFHRLTLSKQLWITLVEDLAARFLVDLPLTRSLAELSLDEVVGLVKRTVVGPATWCLGTSPSVVERISIPTAGLAEKVELLSGGRHLLVKWSNRIELWSVDSGCALLWSRRCEWDTGYAFDMLEDGPSVIVFLARFESLHVIQVRFDGTESQDLFDLRLPANCGVETNIRPVVCGGLLAQAICCRGRPAVHAFLLMDWRLQKYVLIRYFPPSLPLIWDSSAPCSCPCPRPLDFYPVAECNRLRCGSLRRALARHYFPHRQEFLGLPRSQRCPHHHFAPPTANANFRTTAESHVEPDPGTPSLAPAAAWIQITCTPHRRHFARGEVGGLCLV